MILHFVCCLSTYTQMNKPKLAMRVDVDISLYMYGITKSSNFQKNNYNIFIV